MGSFLSDRERTAENIYVHTEETRFLARRRGVEALGVWAGEGMELSPEDRTAYSQHLVDAFLSGISEDRLVMSVQTDLERAGKPAMSTTVATVLAQAVAAALEITRAQPDVASPMLRDPRADWERRHPRPHNWGWGL